MVRNEVTYYIALQDKERPKEPPADKTMEEAKRETIEELIEKISIFISDENQVERIKELLHAFRNDRERQLFASRLFGGWSS